MFRFPPVDCSCLCLASLGKFNGVTFYENPPVCIHIFIRSIRNHKPTSHQPSLPKWLVLITSACHSIINDLQLGQLQGGLAHLMSTSPVWREHGLI